MKVCRFIFLFVFCFNFMEIEVFAQYDVMNSFSDYSAYLSKVADISCKKPKDFIWEKLETSYKTQSNWEQKSFVSFYGGKMQSKDGDCLILYSNLTAAFLNKAECGCTFIRRQMAYDMKKVSDEAYPSDLRYSNIGDNVIKITDKNVPFNADTVFIVQLPIKKPYLGKYKYSMGIYACKSGRVPISFKCYFTDKGEMEKRKFLSKFYKTIKYRNNDNWSYDSEKMMKVLHELYLKSKK
ncbi:hypothetical protein SAMN05444349_1299 [Bacteroides faecichinchillae]|uniref:GLPGLI family protein n=2 Tax=Bacteroides faecichinchillae TaxID=871325 RepID=A0A1M5DIK3_9BACE|nr:hypothetical protein SAMN05444349_1299 [Bacteroides faecichinchillae]